MCPDLRRVTGSEYRYTYIYTRVCIGSRVDARHGGKCIHYKVCSIRRIGRLSLVVWSCFGVCVDAFEFGLGLDKYW